MLSAISDLSFNVYNCLMMFGVIQGITIGALLLTPTRRENISNIFLAATLFIFALYNFKIVLLDINAFTYYADLVYFPFNYILGFGPCIYLYVEALLTPGYKWRYKKLLHFLPLCIEMLYYLLPFFVSNPLSYLQPPHMIWMVASQIEQFASIISVLVYSIFSFRLIARKDKHLERLTKIWLYWLIGAYILLWVIWLLYTIIDVSLFHYQLSIQNYYPVYILVALLTYIIGLRGYLHPSVLPTDADSNHISIPGTKNHLSSIEEHDLQLYQEKLLEMMKKEKLFLDSNFSLKSLSDKTSISTNNISYIINNRIGKNFSDWVNTYRIEEVMKKVLDEKYANLTLSGIASECGFNSKATFYRNFKKHTQMSPKEYIDKNRSNIQV